MSYVRKEMRMKIEKATMEDAFFLWKLKNDPVMRQFAVVTSKKIKWLDHLNWLKGHLDEMNIAMEGKSKKIGMVRISKDKEISINIHPDYRGKGYGSKILERFCPKGVWAKIVNGNVASMKLFLAQGFEITGYENNYYVLKN